mgnify:CR=1 FL=1
MLNKEQTDFLLVNAYNAAIRAGARIIDIYTGDADFAVDIKSDHTPITIADRDAHELIKKYLSQTRVPLLSEEGRDLLYEERRNWDLFWMVDPLDGTKEFLKGNGEFTVNIALMHNNEPYIGVIYVPYIHKIYFALKGAGCYLKTDVEPDHEASFDLPQIWSDTTRLPLCDKAVSDNITLIRTPLYLRENVELMRRMIPGMDSLIFVGDGRYINQQADSDLRELLDREFPQIDYRFYSAHEMSTEALLDSLNRIDIHRTGILFSSWHYTKKIGDNIVSVTDSYRVIASVQAPMFALMPADIRDGGLVGGYVYDDAEVNAHVISTIDAVLAGHQPRDIPFYAPQDARPVFNYAALERKDLSPHTCPANTLFYNKPVSTLEQYKWAIGGIVLLLLAFIGIQQWRIRMMYRVESARQRESESLAKYSNLFNAMPIVYIQMKVIYDENGNPADALYCDVNSRYERIFIPREQAIGRRVSELFPFPMTEFMRLIKIAQTENRTITYPYYYEPRDIFYEVVISRSYLEEHIDIFCLDGTALYKTQQKLDSINHKLAMALDVADIVPWKWDLRKGSILCDVNKSVHGQMLAEANADQQLEVPSESYFAKIHKEDRERVRRAYDDLIAGRKDKVREEYRVASEVSARTGEAFVPSTYKRPFVDVNTYELTYVSLVEGHLIPYFGAARLSDIRPADIQAYFATKTECSESRLKK